MPLCRPALGRVLGFALFALVLTTTGASAAPQIIRHEPKPFGTIEGQVFSSAGFAVPKARVMVQDSDGKKPRTILTDGQGRFRFLMLPIGLYDVSASSKERSSEWRQNLIVQSGKRTTVTLHLNAKKPAPKIPAGINPPAPASSKQSSH